MVSGPVTLRQKEEEKVEAVTDLIILGSKITVDGDYSHEIKRCLLFNCGAAKDSSESLGLQDQTSQS